MQIKRFEARDMAAALRKVKKEFGEQAVILSAKNIKPSGGIFGAHRRGGVEITAASDRFPSPEKPASKQFSAVLPPVVPDPANPLGRELPVETVSAHKQPPPVSGVEAPPTPAPLSSPAVRAPADAVKAPKPGPELAEFKRALLAQDVDNDLAARMVYTVSRDIESGEQTAAGDLNRRFKHLLKDQLTIAEPGQRKKDAPKVVALVGPSGVGKTTTAAKLAAITSAYEGAAVGLISLDHQRIGGTAQLEMFAQVMDLPLIVIKDKTAVKAALAEMRSMDLILVDTPGISGQHTPELKQLDQLLQHLRPDETHLLLSASTKDRDLHLLAEQFNRVGYNRLIFTKLDETTVYGNLLNLMITNKTPLSYLTDGPKVPEGLITATAEAVIELFALQGSFQDGPAAESRGTGVEAAAAIPPRPANPEATSAHQDYFVANRNSDIFHQPDCKAVKRINPENIFVFKNMGEAKAQNFKPCRMCCAMRLSKRPAFEAFRLKAVGG
jgi:flagellar biosynthesis protein FlhF